MAIDAKYFLHPSDKAAMSALRAIPGFHQLMKAFMSVWNEKLFRIENMSGRIRINENQLSKYYDLLPPICEKLGIDVPELYLELNVTPNAYTYGDTKPFIVITSGLLETIPEELLPTVLAHECGHIACHHTLYTTIGRMLLSGAATLITNFIPYGNVAIQPIILAFYYWMRCSEFSADRAAVICDGNADNTERVCMHLAGFDKDINGEPNKEEFLKQAREYREMTADSKWDKILEFYVLSQSDHPLMAVRTLESEEWFNSEQYQKIADGSYLEEDIPDEETPSEDDAVEAPEEVKEEKAKIKFAIPFLKKKEKEQADASEDKPEAAPSIPNQLREYKALLDEGIITEEEFAAIKKQLLGM